MNKTTIQKIAQKSVIACSIIVGLSMLQGCSPEVGSPEWCANMKEKPKGDWTANEAADYAKNCIF